MARSPPPRPLWNRKTQGIGHGRPQIPRFGREKWCLNVAKPKNFIDFSLQNVTVRHFLAFWKLFFYRGSFKHKVFTWVRASEALLGLILGLLVPPGAHFGPPGASSGRLLGPFDAPMALLEAPGGAIPRKNINILEHNLHIQNYTKST